MRRYFIHFILLFMMSVLFSSAQALSSDFFPKMHTALDEISARFQGGAFTIVGLNLPTQVIDKGQTAAYFKVSNHTSHYLKNNYVEAIPNNTQLVTTGTGICGSQFDLSPAGASDGSDSCEVKLLVTGSVNNIPELYVYNEDGTARTGYNQPWNVQAIPATSITVTPSSNTLYVGQSYQYAATASDSSGTVSGDISTVAAWSSSDDSIASVDPSTGNVSANGPGTASITATFQNISGSGSLAVNTASLDSITVTPTNITLTAGGTTQQYTATGNYSDGSKRNLTSSVTWAESSGGVVASISAGGLVSPLSAGSTTVSASIIISGVTTTGQTGLEVTAATLKSIEVEPTNPNIALGRTEQFTATGTFSDNSQHDITTQVTWNSKDVSVATISNSADTQGVATTLSAGSTLITAADPGTNISGNTTLTVSSKVLTKITLSPTSPSLVEGSAPTAFTATGTYSDGSTGTITNSVNWTTGDTSILTVSNTSPTQGYATPGVSGTTTIIATDATTGVSANTPVNVVPATLLSLAVAPSSAVVPNGKTQTYIAAGTLSNGRVITPFTDVIWSVVNPPGTSVARIDSSTGVATAIAPSGTASIVATSGSISASATLTAEAAALTSITMSPTSYTVGVGLTSVAGQAIGHYSDGTSKAIVATWTSADPTIATATSITSPPGGTVSGVKAGTTRVTASVGSISAFPSASVTVKGIDHITISPATQTIPVLTGVGVGGTQQYAATAVFTDGSTQDVTGNVTWSSSNTEVATISNAAGSHGLATAVSQNSTPVTITAQLGTGGPSATASLTIGGPVPITLTISPINPTIGLGASQQFTALVTFADKSSTKYQSGVTWTSSNKNVATISSSGLASTLTTGTSNINATYQETIGGTTYTVSNGTADVLTVTAATLQSIAISPGSLTVAVGTSQHFTALGTYTDSSTHDVTDQATWTSSDTTIVASPLTVVESTSGSYANAPVLPAATVGHHTTIQAQVGAISSTVTLTAGSPIVLSISVAPATSTITFTSSPITYTATANESDGSSHDVTSLVTWTSTTANIVSLAANVASPGTTIGATTIEATSTDSVVGSASLQLASTGTVAVGSYSTAATAHLPFTYTLGTYPAQSTPFYISSYILPLNSENLTMSAVTCIAGTNTCLAIGSGTSGTLNAGYVYQSSDKGLTWGISPILLYAPSNNPLTLTGITCAVNGGSTYCHIAGYYTSSGVFYPIVYSSSNSGSSWNSGVPLNFPSASSTQLTGVACSTVTQQCMAIGNNFAGGTGANALGVYYNAGNALDWAAQTPNNFGQTNVTVNGITVNSTGAFVVAGQHYTSATISNALIYAQLAPSASFTLIPVDTSPVSAVFNGVSCAGTPSSPSPYCVAVGNQTATGSLAPTTPLAMSNNNYGTTAWTLAATNLSFSGSFNGVSCSATTGVCFADGFSYTTSGLQKPLVMSSSNLAGSNWAYPSNATPPAAIATPSNFTAGILYGIAQTTA